MAVILIVAAPMSILRSFFIAGYTASVPALVGRPQIGRANSYFEAVYSAGFIVGPAIAGLLAIDHRSGPDARDRRRLVRALRRSGLLLVRRDLRAPDRPAADLAPRPRSAKGSTTSSTTRCSAAVILFWGATSILMAPLVTALAVTSPATSASRRPSWA